MKDYLLNLLGNVEVADLITPPVTQLTTLLSEPACRLCKPIEIDYNFIGVEHQYLFDIAGKHFTKESGSLKASPRAFIRYEYSESKNPNPAPFIEGANFHFAIFSNSNQLISKLIECPKILFGTFKLVPRLLIFYRILSCLVTPYHTLSLLVTPYHTISPRLGRKPFSIGNIQISSLAPDFLSHLITPCHSLSYLITPYPLGLKENHFHLANFKLVPRFLIFYHILSHLGTPYHILSHLKTQVGKNHFHLAIFKLVPRLLIFYHVLSHLVMLYHTLSHLIPQVGQKTTFIWQLSN